MTCSEVRALTPPAPACCSACHEEAEHGLNLGLEGGTEPCCILVQHARAHNLDPYEPAPAPTRPELEVHLL